MGIYLGLVSHDQMYHGLSSQFTRIVNDQSLVHDEDREDIRRLIFTEYEGEVLDNVPSCLCERLTKARNVGKICTNCHTKVEYRVERDLEPILWVRRPGGVNGGEGVERFINPHFWLMLTLIFNKNNFDQVRWIVDTRYNPIQKREGAILRLSRSLEQRGIRRGWNSFVRNFDSIMEILLETLKRGDTKVMFERMLADPECRQGFFSDYLPFPNRAMLVLEKNNLGKYCEKSLGLAVDAAMTLYGIDTPECAKPLHIREHLTWKTVHLLAQYSLIQYKEVLGKKPGLFRRDMLSCRCRFSGRNVVTSKTGQHDYRQIDMSWGLATTMLRVHLVNKLLREGYTPKDYERLLNEHALRYNPVIDRLFNELIAESSYDLGIPCSISRQPIMERASMQSVFIGNIKRSNDPTNSVSILDCVGMNMDFDGDNGNYTLYLDRYITDAMRELNPSRSAFDMDEPHSISPNLSTSKPLVQSKSIFLQATKTAPPNPAVYAEMVARFSV